MGFYGKFIELCAKNKVSASLVAEKIGLSRASAWGWKNGALPSDVNMQKIADFFNVSVEHLKEETEAPTDLEPNKTNPLPEEEERIRELYNLTNDMTENELNALRAFVAGLKANRKQD